ncbi:MAG: glycosyl hydrolase family 95 catalytic domain-containing protein [Phycisphaerae bacterium]
MRKIGVLACAVAMALAVRGVFAGGMVEVDYRGLVSRGDLDYSAPARRSEEGMPVGNGRMGSLVWTTPDAMHMQINRVDVFGENSYTVSFPKQDSDYASGCGYLDIVCSRAGEDVFSGGDFHQHLSCYDGGMTVAGKGVTARVIAWPVKDVMAVEVDDERENPEEISVDLRMLRYAVQNITGKNWKLTQEHAVDYRTVEQSALSRLDIQGGRILLTQEFSEGADFYSASGVAVGIVGRASTARYLNGATVEVTAAAGKGKFVILISSAASATAGEDVGKLALGEMEGANGKGFAELEKETSDWWHDYWGKSFVAMHSGDGQADFVEGNYTYFQYVMGASSRGKYPPRFGGMLWYTNGDMRRWGSQYWWANESALYSNLMPANRMKVMEPLFDVYSGMLEACGTAAKQQWGAEGVWIPEITFYNGPEKLPEEMVKEFQDLFLVRKTWDERSAKFDWWSDVKNRHNSRYNFLADGHFEHGHYVVPTKGKGIFGHCTHIMSDAAKIGALFYAKYEFTGDEGWLRERAWPVIRGAAEFYRTFPNVQKGEDGKWHIHHVNNGEGAWDFSDTPNEIAGMRLAFTDAVKASKILGVDGELRGKWEEMVENLAPEQQPPRNGRPAAFNTAEGGGPRTRPSQGGAERARGERPFGSFVYGGPGAIEPRGEDVEQKKRFLGFDALGSFIDPTGSGGAQIFRNRMRLREGPGATDVEHIAGLTMGIHSTLLSSVLGENGVAHVEVFGKDWPRSWDCAFTLLARGGFEVTSALKGREVRFVEVKAQRAGACEVAIPWEGGAADEYQAGRKVGHADGARMVLKMAAGEDVVLVPTGARVEGEKVPE